MTLHEQSLTGSLSVPHEGELRRLADGSWEIWLLPVDGGTAAAGAARLVDLEGRRVRAQLAVERQGGVDRVYGQIDGVTVGAAHRTVASRLVVALAGGPIECSGRVAMCSSGGGRYRLALAVVVPPGVITPGLG